MPRKQSSTQSDVDPRWNGLAPGKIRVDGSLIYYNLEGVQVAPPDLPQADEPAPESEFEPGSFADRVLSRRVKLGKMVRDGIPPIDFLPLCDGMLVRGKRHECAAPSGMGKSIAWQSHSTRMALAGARVAIFDKENGEDEYGRRLQHIAKAWELSDEDLERIDANLFYFAWPEFKATDTIELVSMLLELDIDLVIFDSQRMMLSDFGLRENEADDFATFSRITTMPLSRAKIASLILDNTGHRDANRPRGSITKLDQTEVGFILKSVTEFDMFQIGKLELVLTKRRFGTRGTWRMSIGGGVFDYWLPTNVPTGAVVYKRTPRELVLSVCTKRMTGNQMEGLWHGQGHGDKTLRDERDKLVKEKLIGCEPSPKSGSPAWYWPIKSQSA